MECCNSDSKTQIHSCLKCGEDGLHVKLVTIKSHLLDQYKDKVSETNSYNFCKNPSCDVVYFSSVGELYLKSMLREKVTLKESSLDVKTCYCFNVTKGDIENEIKRTGQSNVVEVIKEKMRNLGCFCETLNPQGSCCLANNFDFIKKVLSEV